MKNLLFAISLIDKREIEVFLFIGRKTSREFVDEFQSLGTIVKTPLLDTDTVSGIVHKILQRIFFRSFLFGRLMRENSIDVLSHSALVTRGNWLKCINWIPDFQHKYLPRMFSLIEIGYRNIMFAIFAKESDAVILSSNDAFSDYESSYPRHFGRAHVLPFVSQPDKKIYEISDTRKIEEKYGFTGKFFYLPNQLWKHKNHMVVLKALHELKEEGRDILVLCSGQTGDYRNKNHFEEIKKYIRDNKLESNVRFLGLIEYIDVLTLMRHCISIINPSLFEGWSSTVEEAKSIGKNMILSNLRVHIEQNPPYSVYFDPLDEKDLAEKLWKKWSESDGGPDFELEKCARENIESRTMEFGRAYQDIVLGILKKEKSIS